MGGGRESWEGAAGRGGEGKKKHHKPPWEVAASLAVGVALVEQEGRGK